MTNAPLITAVLPWNNSLVKKTQQRLAAQNPFKIRVGGSVRGWEITATPQQFLDLGLAKESGELSLPLVSRLRQAGFRVQGSRTVHLPGGTGVVEVQIDQTPEVIGRVLGCLERRDGADVVTVYDRAGVGHTRVLGAIETVTRQPKAQLVRVARRKRWATRESALVDAIRQIWEDKAEEFTRNVSWDGEDYEAYTVQELVSGMLDEFLTDDQLKQWNSLEAEAQTGVLNAAFPEDKIQDTVNRVDRSFWSRERGASRRIFAEQPPPSLDQPPQQQQGSAGTSSEVDWRTIDHDTFDWSDIEDPWKQMQRAREVLIDRPPSPSSPSSSPVTSGKKKPRTLSTEPLIKEVKDQQKRVTQYQQELAELQATNADPKLIKRLERTLKEAEQDLVNLSTPRSQDWHTIEGLTKAARVFLEKMGGDVTYVDWYDRHVKHVNKLYEKDIKWGGGPNVFYRMMAALSPRTKVQINAARALGSYAIWKEAAMNGNKSFQFSKATTPAGVMDSQIDNLNRALRKEKLSGPKVYPFSENLMGDTEEVTIDMWMGRLFFAKQAVDDDEIEFGKKVVRAMALEMGKTPRYVQGLLWEMTMDHWGEPPADFMVAINKSLDAHAKWQTFNITPPDWWKKQEQAKKKLERDRIKLEKTNLLQQQKEEKQKQKQLLRDQKKLQPKSAPVVPSKGKKPKPAPTPPAPPKGKKPKPAASRRVAFTVNDDPKEVAMAVMEILGLSPANPGEAPHNPMDMAANEAPAVSRASRFFD